MEDLAEVGELAGRLFSPEQIIDLAYMIISKHRIFRDDIRAWMRRPQSEKTWINFKEAFLIAHQELRDTDATVDELGYHSDNEIVSQIVDQLRTSSKAHDSSQRDDVPAIDMTPDTDTSSEANFIQTSDPAMTTLMASMMTNMEAMMLRLESNEKNT